MKILIISAMFLMATLSVRTAAAAHPASNSGNKLEEIFLNPRKEHKPLIIWQWMDGLVTRDGITLELEAFHDAGLAGVQNFQIGGPLQTRIGNPDNSIGSDNWKSLMKWTLAECERLDLTFGTHNCPGWSSSAYPSVRPEYSMQKLVYTETPATKATNRNRQLTLPRPETDSIYNYYEDVAIMAIPSDSIASLGEIIDLTGYFNPRNETIILPESISLPKKAVILRIGQTTNGKTNHAQAPESGRGLECDKLSREAVKKFWDGYPAMILDLARDYAGKTFTHFEIDSYEAGGQTWSPVLPEEFRQRAGYDLTPYLPYMAGRIKIVADNETTERFRKDWERTVRECVAENYYGYMTELANNAGVKMMIEPYGTGGQRPFHILDFDKIVTASKGADIATEFWQEPNWGWKDMRRHEKSMRRLRMPLLMAEAFTCWPLRAWSDSPASLKPICDRAFCTGVNRMMLHAGASNPWPEALPGMSFGMWGTQFVPTQTWWKAGGAKELFNYMARCQALLQQGLPAEEQITAPEPLQTYRRIDGDTDILFVCNPTDSAARGTITPEIAGRCVEIWNPYNLEMNSMKCDHDISLDIEPFGSRFVIIRPGVSHLPERADLTDTDIITIENNWTLTFGDSLTVATDTLKSWTEWDNPEVKYFSGTASYSGNITLPETVFSSVGCRLTLNLGDVHDMAKVKVNGKEMPLLWKAPYVCDITDAVVSGENNIEIEVTNLWRNRMIGDELEPDDMEWSEPFMFTAATKEVGRFLTKVPDWLQNGTSRPSKGRKTTGCFKFFNADSPLLPSGMLGPVSLTTCSAK